MKQELLQSASDVLKDARAASVVSTSTMAAGLGEFLDLISWGVVAAVPGAALSLVMIYVQLSRWFLERRRMLLEIRALKAKEEERLQSKKAPLP